MQPGSSRGSRGHGQMNSSDGAISVSDSNDSLDRSQGGGAEADQKRGGRNLFGRKKRTSSETSGVAVASSEIPDAEEMSIDERIARANWEQEQLMRKVQEGDQYVPSEYPGDEASRQPAQHPGGTAGGERPGPGTAVFAPAASAGPVGGDPNDLDDLQKRQEWEMQELARKVQVEACGEEYKMRPYPNDLITRDDPSRPPPKADGSLADMFGQKAYGGAGSATHVAEVGAQQRFANPLPGNTGRAPGAGWNGVFGAGGPSTNVFSGAGSGSSQKPAHGNMPQGRGPPVYMPQAPSAAYGGGVPVYAPPATGYGHVGGAPTPRMVQSSGYPSSVPGGSGGVPVYAPLDMSPVARAVPGTGGHYAPPAAASAGVYSGPGIDPRVLERIKEGRAEGERAQVLHADGMSLRKSGLRSEAGPAFRGAAAAYRGALSKLVPCRRELDMGSDASRLARQAERAKLDKLVTLLLDKLEEITPLATDDVPMLRPREP